MSFGYELELPDRLKRTYNGLHCFVFSEVDTSIL